MQILPIRCFAVFSGYCFYDEVQTSKLSGEIRTLSPKSAVCKSRMCQRVEGMAVLAYDEHGE